MTHLARAIRLAALVAQHPTHRHRERVRRGLDLRWLDDFARYWNQPGVKPVGLPITDYASFQAVRYHFAAKFREACPAGDNFDHPDAQRARLLSYVWRRAMHPLRWLPAAWHLRECKTVLEYGAGAAPYAHGITTAWPFHQYVFVMDIPGMLYDYCRWRFKRESDVEVRSLSGIPRGLRGFEGIVCTEVFEHVPDPVETAQWMTSTASVIAFDYVLDMEPAARTRRADTLTVFAMTGKVSGPDARGLYVWRMK